MICLYCCGWYSCPYAVQHHKTTKTVAFKVHSYLLTLWELAIEESGDPCFVLTAARQ
jgi:hypothetical protein